MSNHATLASNQSTSLFSAMRGCCQGPASACHGRVGSRQATAPYLVQLGLQRVQTALQRRSYCRDIEDLHTGRVCHKQTLSVVCDGLLGMYRRPRVQDVLLLMRHPRVCTSSKSSS